MGSFEKQGRNKGGGKGISKKSVRIILFCSLVNCVLVCILFFSSRKSCPSLFVLPSESQIMARYDLVNPETRARYRDMPKKKPGLLTLSVGKSEGPNVDKLLESFDEAFFDVILFHYSADDTMEAWTSTYKWAKSRHVRHIFDPHKLKLDFGRLYLSPTITDKYEYIFFWDEDGQIPDESKKFWGNRAVKFFSRNNIDFGGPTFTMDSTVTYAPKSKYSPALGELKDTELVVEIGFQIWSSKAWIFAHRILQKYPFRLWYFDALPWKCIGAGAIKRIKYMNRLPIRHVRQSSEARLPLETDTIRDDINYRNDIIDEFGCCEYLEKLRMQSIVTRKEEGVEFLNCKLGFPDYLLRKE